MKLDELADHLDAIKCGPGDGWRYEIETLRSLYNHERSKLSVIEGERYQILAGNNPFSQPAMEPGRIVTLAEVYWSSHSKNWQARVQPDREWWWDRFGPDGPGWRESNGQVHTYTLAVGRLSGVFDPDLDDEPPTIRDWDSGKHGPRPRREHVYPREQVTS